METIGNGIHQISYGYVNSFIIDGDEGVTLIDTGLPKKYDVTVDALTSIGRSVTDVTAILLTHSHTDHAGGAARLKRASQASLYVSEPDSAAVRGDERSPSPPMMDRVPFLQPLLRFLPAAEGAEADHVIGEAANSSLPGDLRVLDTPGHTPGHVSYVLDRAGGVLFVGDAATATKKGAVKRGWMNRRDDIFDASLRHISDQVFDVALFGHSAPLRQDAAASFKRFVSSI